MKFLRFPYKAGIATSNIIVSFSLNADIVPPCNSTISFEIASPSPAPPF